MANSISAPNSTQTTPQSTPPPSPDKKAVVVNIECSESKIAKYARDAIWRPEDELALRYTGRRF